MKSQDSKTRPSVPSPKPETRTFQTVDTSLWKRLEDMASGCRCMQFLLEHLFKGRQHADSPSLTSIEPEETRKHCQQTLAKSAQQGLSAAKHETWDDWCRRAVDAGVDEPVAALGKRLIRETNLQGWTFAQQAEFGWYDDGQAMIDTALLMPELAAYTWQLLLDSGPDALPTQAHDR